MIKPEDISRTIPADFEQVIAKAESVLNKELREKNGVAWVDMDDHTEDKRGLNSICRRYKDEGFDVRVEWRTRIGPLAKTCKPSERETGHYRVYVTKR